MIPVEENSISGSILFKITIRHYNPESKDQTVICAEHSTAVAILCCLMTTILLGGCYPIDQTGYMYVYEKAGPHANQVTSWTLRQHYAPQILDGQRALAHIASKDTPDETEAAMDGFVQVHEKAVSGWKEFVGPPKYPTWPLEIVIMDDYDVLASALVTTPHREPIRRAMLRIEPPVEESKRHAAWREVATRFNIVAQSPRN